VAREPASLREVRRGTAQPALWLLVPGVGRRSFQHNGLDKLAAPTGGSDSKAGRRMLGKRRRRRLALSRHVGRVGTGQIDVAADTGEDPSPAPKRSSVPAPIGYQ
jgi:hypothetical protein